ncbi:MAG: two-component system, chemotaxis family, chemotaxis protein CheY [Clostridiales bacterium]|nr:two-component system, chemotaxis family, chemotaxis protein CheY [Clostridiales bacterium]
MKRIMVVDDASFMRATLKTMLEKNGFVVVAEAEDGNEAIEKYGEIKPDIVTMDITMPKLGGLEALKGIMEADPKAKVLMVSAMGQEDKVRQAIMFGARSFVVKPFKEEQLIKVLHQIG